VVYSNPVGIITSNGMLRNNLIYANTVYGFRSPFRRAGGNNTIVQTAGDAVRLADS